MKRDKKKKFFSLVIAFFIVSIMVASVLNYSIHSGFNPDTGSGDQGQQEIIYNGYQFIPTLQGWVTEIDGRQILLAFGPQQVEDIDVREIDFSSLRLSEKIYLSIDPNKRNQINSAGDLIRNIVLPRTVQSCPEDLPGCENLPLKTCSEATDSTGVIHFEEGETEIIQLENNCLFVQAPDSRINLIIDKIVYEELEII